MRALFLISTLLFLIACGGGNSHAGGSEGKQLYSQHCSNCHMDDGTGLGALNPPLAGSDMLKAGGAGAACWIRNGMKGPIVVNGQEYNHLMTANKQLTATQITNILNYVNNAWGNQADFITLKAVEEALKGCPTN